MVVEHAKKHDINSDKDHIKNDLDLNGNFTIPFDKQILLGRGSNYEDYSFFKWDDTNSRFLMGRSLELQGNLYLSGESNIFGGNLNNDSITIRGSRTAPYPRISIEGDTSVYYLIENNSSQFFAIGKSGLNITDLFKIDKDYLSLNVPISTSTLIENSAAIISDAGFYWDYPDGLTYSLLDSSDNTLYINNSRTNGIIHLSSENNYIEGTNNDIDGETTIGDGGNNDYTHFSNNGLQTMVGKARVWKTKYHYAYNMNGNSATYNSLSCDAAGSSVVGDKWVMKTFGDGSGFGSNPEAAILTMVIPSDYQAGEDVKITINWTSSSTSGNVVWGIGFIGVSGGEGYDGSETYQTTTETAPTTAYVKKTFELTFSGANLNPLDEVSIIIYRNCDDSNDDMSGDAYVSTIGLKYISNKLGEGI